MQDDENAGAEEAASEEVATWEFPSAAYATALAQYDVDAIAATQLQLATLIVIDEDNADTYQAENDAYDAKAADAKTKLQDAQDAEDAAAGGGSTVIVIVAVLAVVIGGGLIYWFKCRGDKDENEGGNREPLYI